MKGRNLRYYLRGLGIGILVTTAILVLTEREPETLTDAQIRERALQLGMVDGDSVKLAELQKSAEEPSAGSDEEEGSPESGGAQAESTEESVQSSEAEEEPPESSMAEEEPAESGGAQEPASVTFVIRSGASSYRVSKDLEEAGLIADADDFDAYLCNSGYSKSIRVGSYDLTPGLEMEEIARIITGGR